MKHYVQLKDGVGFATISSDKGVETSDFIVEVEDNPEQFLNRKYNGSTFLDAEIIKYAIVDSDNTIIDIRKTYFSSDVEKNNGIEINNDNVKVLWKWNGKHGSEKEFTAQ